MKGSFKQWIEINSFFHLYLTYRVDCVIFQNNCWNVLACSPPRGVCACIFLVPGVKSLCDYQGLTSSRIASQMSYRIISETNGIVFNITVHGNGKASGYIKTFYSFFSIFLLSVVCPFALLQKFSFMKLKQFSIKLP